MRWEELLDGARAEGLAEGRVRERWLRQQATESATLLGTLLDLAERGAAVSIALVGGRRHEGIVIGVGAGVAVLRERSDVVVVAATAIATIRPAPGHGGGPATGDRAAALELSIGEVLARAIGGDDDVAISLVTGESVAGRLVAVGADVLTVRVAPGADGLVYCSVSTVSSVRFRSG